MYTDRNALHGGIHDHDKVISLHKYFGSVLRRAKILIQIAPLRSFFLFVDTQEPPYILFTLSKQDDHPWDTQMREIIESQR